MTDRSRIYSRRDVPGGRYDLPPVTKTPVQRRLEAERRRRRIRRLATVVALVLVVGVGALGFLMFGQSSTDPGDGPVVAAFARRVLALERERESVVSDYQKLRADIDGMGITNFVLIANDIAERQSLLRSLMLNIDSTNSRTAMAQAQFVAAYDAEAEAYKALAESSGRVQTEAAHLALLLGDGAGLDQSSRGIARAESIRNQAYDEMDLLLDSVGLKLVDLQTATRAQ